MGRLYTHLSLTLLSQTKYNYDQNDTPEAFLTLNIWYTLSCSLCVCSRVTDIIILYNKTYVYFTSMYFLKEYAPGLQLQL